MLFNVHSVDDLYLFFDKKLPEVNQLLTNLQLSIGGGMGVSQPQLVVVTGSQLDLFLRRCILAFNQLMFQDLQALFEAFNLYREG